MLAKRLVVVGLSIVVLAMAIVGFMVVRTMERERCWDVKNQTYTCTRWSEQEIPGTYLGIMEGGKVSLLLRDDGTFEERFTFTIRSRLVGVLENGMHRTVEQKLPADMPETLIREGTWTLQHSGAFLHVLVKDAYISPLWWDRRDDSGFAEPSETLEIKRRDWDFSVVGLNGPRLSVGDPEGRVVLDRMVNY